MAPIILHLLLWLDIGVNVCNNCVSVSRKSLKSLNRLLHSALLQRGHLLLSDLVKLPVLQPGHIYSSQRFLNSEMGFF